MFSNKKRSTQEKINNKETHFGTLYNRIKSNICYIIPLCEKKKIKKILLYFLGVILFAYYVLNNYRFDKGNPIKWLGIVGAILLVLFYGVFIATFYFYYKDMIDENKNKDGSYKIFNIVVLSILTILTIVSTFYIIPRYMTNAGIIAKGLLRVWNPFYDISHSPNQEQSGGNNNNDGYDNNSLKKRGGDFLSQLKWLLCSFPIRLSLYNPAFSLFNYYLISAIEGDGSDSGSNWAKNCNNIESKEGGLKYGFFILTFPWRIIINILKIINININPIDWDLMENFKDDQNICNLINKKTSVFGEHKIFDFWIPIFLIVFFIQNISSYLIFPSKNYSFEIIVSLSVALLSSFYITYVNCTQEKSNINFFNLETSNDTSYNVNNIKEKLQKTSENVDNRLFYFITKSKPKLENVNPKYIPVAPEIPLVQVEQVAQVAPEIPLVQVEQVAQVAPEIPLVQVEQVAQVAPEIPLVQVEQVAQVAPLVQVEQVAQSVKQSEIPVEQVAQSVKQSEIPVAPIKPVATPVTEKSEIPVKQKSLQKTAKKKVRRSKK